MKRTLVLYGDATKGTTQAIEALSKGGHHVIVTRNHDLSRTPTLKTLSVRVRGLKNIQR